MSRYNAWQNNQLSNLLNVMDAHELTKERGAFFGSVLGTLNHLLWGDQMWMSRFDGGDAPTVGIPDSPKICADLNDWQAARSKMDLRLELWANGLEDEFLQQDMTWFSGALGREVTRPVGMLVSHMFNHQTHHRGQIHAMMTASGSKAPVSDLFSMPDEG